MRFQGVMLIAGVLAMPVTAAAQPIQGLYVGTGVGADFAQSPRVTLPSGFGGGHGTLNENIGFDAVMSLGYALGNGMRFEVEGNFRRNGIGGFTAPAVTAATGTVRTYGVMANALFDMDIGSPWVYPYLGGGAGYQWTKLAGAAFTNPATGFAYSTDDTQGGFAWQAMAGLSFPVPNTPGLSVTAEYRFMNILGGEKFDGSLTTAAGTVPATIKLSNQFNHSLMLGVRYAFNVPPPPAPPAPAPQAAPAAAPTRSYLVFFDWDKATLTDRARQIVKEAADNSTRVQYTRIEVNGYTDTSGTSGYNQRLSVRRAQAVAAELVKDGVPRNSIAIRGFGETHLLVPTGPGVREAQNRRVEIIIK
jgi:outer membrane protein OmpA-like peptidoglycan-associated protein